MLVVSYLIGSIPTSYILGMRLYGTYLKSFYSVMYCPSGVKVMLFCDGQQKNEQGRYHHNINWNAVAPKILRPQA